MSPALLGITTTAKKLRGWLWLKAVNCWSAKCILSAERTPCVVRLNKPKIHSFSDRRTPPLRPFKHSPSHGWSLASMMPLLSVVASGPKQLRWTCWDLTNQNVKHCKLSIKTLTNSQTDYWDKALDVESFAFCTVTDHVGHISVMPLFTSFHATSCIFWTCRFKSKPVGKSQQIKQQLEIHSETAVHCPPQGWRL